jgi:hypothetical protein
MANLKYKYVHLNSLELSGKDNDFLALLEI